MATTTLEAHGVPQLVRRLRKAGSMPSSARDACPRRNKGFGKVDAAHAKECSKQDEVSADGPNGAAKGGLDRGFVHSQIRSQDTDGNPHDEHIDDGDNDHGQDDTPRQILLGSLKSSAATAMASNPVYAKTW